MVLTMCNFWGAIIDIAKKKKRINPMDVKKINKKIQTFSLTFSYLYKLIFLVITWLNSFYQLENENHST